MQTNNKKFGFRTIIKGFLGAFNIEKGIVPTLIDLFIRPLEVIKYYIEEGEGKYFSPGRFFVTVIAFLSIITFLNGGFNVEKMKEVQQKIYSAGYSTGYEMGGGGNKNLNEVLSNNKHLQSKIETGSKISFFFLKNIWVQFLMYIIPTAFSSWLIFYKSNYKLAVHFVIQVYCWCFIAILTSGILGLFINSQEYMIYSVSNDELIMKFEIYKWASVLIPIIYVIISFKQIFQLNWFKTIFKVTLHCILSLIFVMIPIVILIITSFKT